MCKSSKEYQHEQHKSDVTVVQTANTGTHNSRISIQRRLYSLEIFKTQLDSSTADVTQR